MNERTVRSGPVEPILPGQHILSLPSDSSTIHIRRYTSPTRLPIPPSESSSEAARRSALELLLANSADDALERAWRAVNGQESGAGCEVRDVLASPCAVITREAEEGQRMLWLFEFQSEGDTSQKGRHCEALEALTRESGDFGQLAPAKVIAAVDEAAGLMDVSALTSDGTPGRATRGFGSFKPDISGPDIRWEPGKFARPWQIFTWAVLEKLAWRRGRRMYMQAGSLNDSS
jgi:hypothetical protein